jgi:ankyrin repeat protein
MNKNVLITIGVIAVIVVALPLLIGLVREEPLPPPPTIDIHMAAFAGNAEEIRRHIAHGSNLDERDEKGGTALGTAAVFGHLEAAKALVEAGANLDLRNVSGDTALATAAFLCHTELVQVLLDNGADKNQKNNAGTTALESVAGPFEEVRFIYDIVKAIYEPLGLRMDYAHIEATRPTIAAMLR